MTEAAFNALGDPVRRRIVELLGKREQSAGMVAAAVRDSSGFPSRPRLSTSRSLPFKSGSRNSLMRPRVEPPSYVVTA